MYFEEAHHMAFCDLKRGIARALRRSATKTDITLGDTLLLAIVDY
jgi:hypothetical protein